MAVKSEITSKWESAFEEAYLSYIKLNSARKAYMHSCNGHLVLAVQSMAPSSQLTVTPPISKSSPVEMINLNNSKYKKDSLNACVKLACRSCGVGEDYGEW